MVAVTVNLDTDMAEKLSRLASKLDLPRSELAAQAIADYLAREGWQIAEIEAGIVGAEKGEFGSAEDLARVVARFATLR